MSRKSILRHRGVRRSTSLVVAASTVLLSTSACGGGGLQRSEVTTAPTVCCSPPPTSTPPTSVPAPVPGPGPHCATTSEATECVGNPVYFSASDPYAGSGPEYFARLSYSVSNQSGRTISNVGSDLSIIDSSNATIGDVGGGGVTGVPPDVFNACFDSLDSSLSLTNGERLTLPKPLCFQMAGPDDRVVAVVDGGDNTTIQLSGS